MANVPVVIDAATLNFTIDGGTVYWLGQQFVVPPYSGIMPATGLYEFGAQVDGTAPDGVTLPAIVRLPSVDGLSNLHGLATFEISRPAPNSATVLNQTGDFRGVELWRIQSMNGKIVGIYDLRVYGGIHSSNFINYAIGAPIFQSLPTITPAASTNGVTADVKVICTVTNVPQDKTVAQVAWFFREHVSSGTPNDWVPWADTTLAGNPTPAATQTLTFTYGDLTNSKTYDFGVAYIGLNGSPGNIAPLTGASGFVAQTISIAGQYLLGNGNPAPAPIASGIQLTPRGALVAGISVIVEETFTLTNQPTDGSLQRIGLWYRSSGATKWTENGEIDVVGRGTASGTYDVYETELSNGTAWEFGVSYVGISGTESPITSIGVLSATALAISTNFLRQGNGAAPILATGVSYTETPTTVGISTDVTATFTVSNAPTDGSLLGIVLFSTSKAHPGSPQPALSTGLISILPPAQTNTYSYTFAGLTNSLPVPNANNDGVYLFGIAYAYTNGTYGALLPFPNYTVTAVVSIPGSYLLSNTAWTPAPTLTSGPTNRPAVVGTTSTVNVGLSVAGQPTDGSFAKLNFWYRHSGDTTWAPTGGIAANNPGQSSGNYNFDFVGLDNNSTYDFGISGESNLGKETDVVAIASNWITQTIAYPGTYLVNGASVSAPNFSVQTLAVGDSTNGLSSVVNTAITIYNQPTDGSLSKIVYTYRKVGSLTLSADGAIRATPGGGAASYVYEYNDLTNGIFYDLGVQFEDIAGRLSPIAYLAQGFQAKTVGIPGHYILSNQSYTPSIQVFSGPTNFPSLNGISASVGIQFNIINQPTDGSLAEIVFFFRESAAGDGTWTECATLPAAGAGNYNPPLQSTYEIVYADLTGGKTYDFCVAAVSANGALSNKSVLFAGFTTTTLYASKNVFGDILTNLGIQSGTALITPDPSGILEHIFGFEYRTHCILQHNILFAAPVRITSNPAIVGPGDTYYSWIDKFEIYGDRLQNNSWELIFTKGFISGTATHSDITTFSFPSYDLPTLGAQNGYTASTYEFRYYASSNRYFWRRTSFGGHYDPSGNFSGWDSSDASNPSTYGSVT